MRIRARLAIAIGKTAGGASRLLGLGGGSNLPGRLARRLDRRMVAELVSSLPLGCALVSGTNGKTTTSTLLAAMLEAAGMPPAHNRTGANLLTGIASALIRQSDLSGDLGSRIGLFEVDEAALPSAIDETSPRLVLVNNLFRDQLDRYGELDTLASKMRGGIERLGADAVVALNADDPLVSSIGDGLGQPVVYYGIEAGAYASDTMQHAADSKHCPACGEALAYEYHLFGHMGDYNCPSCGRARPSPEVFASDLRMEGLEGTTCVVRHPEGERSLRIPLPGLYNVYNVLAAFTAARALGVPADACFETVEGFSAAFGRLERVRAGDRNLLMVLAKNPAGFNEVIRTLCAEPGDKDVLLALNDNIADGRDVSWIWDADFEMFAGRLRRVFCSGIRAWDMALRVKYAELGQDSLEVETDLERALDAALEGTPAGGTLYLVPTYTAMLELRKTLVKRGLVAPYWEEG